MLPSPQVNGGGAKMYGAEASYNQVFTLLPKAFDGLEVQASYARTLVRAGYTGRMVATAQGSSDSNRGPSVLETDALTS